MNTPRISALPAYRLAKIAEATRDLTELRGVDVPIPNVYFVTVSSAVTLEVFHLYIAADFSGCALRKVQNLCADTKGFRPYRSNSTIKMRRLRLQDYLENPAALGAAIETAKTLGERDTVTALEQRPEQIAALLATPAAEQVDFDRVAKALGEQLRAVEALG